MMKLRSRLILAVVVALAASFALCELGGEHNAPQRAIQVAPTKNPSTGGVTDLQSAHKAARAAQRWGLGMIWRVKHKLGM
jgi:hypothetical protein